MLEDYIINEQIRYENHYLKVAQTDIEIGGVTGAALLSALIVDTEEGVRRGIAIDSDAERMAWIAKYEREVRREEWGLLGAEVELLNNAHIEIATSDVTWADICPNVRLLDLALQLVTTYMRYLTVETFGNHIWEYQPWVEPFAQWLLNAAHTEPFRQQFLHTEWTDPAQVNALYEDLLKEANGQIQALSRDKLTFIFEGEAAEDIFKRYLTWRWTTYQAQIRELPGAQPRAARHRNFVVARETDWSFIEEAQGLNEAQKQLLTQWMLSWQKFINKHLKPEKEVRFWTEEVSAHRQKQLTQYLRIQEKEWDYFRSLSAAIYALRQMGYVRRACSLRDITRWMSEQLVKDYSTKNNHDQFVRAWKDLGRYTPEVKDYVESLKENGVLPLNSIY